MVHSYHFNKAAAVKAANHMAKQGYYKVFITRFNHPRVPRIKYRVESEGRKRKWLFGKKKGQPIVGRVVDST